MLNGLVRTPAVVKVHSYMHKIDRDMPGHWTPVSYQAVLIKLISFQLFFKQYFQNEIPFSVEIQYTITKKFC